MIGSSLCSSSPVLFIAAFGYVPLPEAFMLAEGFTALFQILYSIAAFGVIYDPGFTSMGLVSVSTPHVLF